MAETLMMLICRHTRFRRINLRSASPGSLLHTANLWLLRVNFWICHDAAVCVFIRPNHAVLDTAAYYGLIGDEKLAASTVH